MKSRNMIKNFSLNFDLIRASDIRAILLNNQKGKTTRATSIILKRSKIAKSCPKSSLERAMQLQTNGQTDGQTDRQTLKYGRT